VAALVLFPGQHDQYGAVVVMYRQPGRLDVFRHSPYGAFDKRSVLYHAVHGQSVGIGYPAFGAHGNQSRHEYSGLRFAGEGSDYDLAVLNMHNRVAEYAVFVKNGMR